MVSAVCGPQKDSFAMVSALCGPQIHILYSFVGVGVSRGQAASKDNEVGIWRPMSGEGGHSEIHAIWKQKGGGEA